MRQALSLKQGRGYGVVERPKKYDLDVVLDSPSQVRIVTFCTFGHLQKSRS